MALPTKYAQAVWDTEGVLATWLPDRRLRVGDIVTRGHGGIALHIEAHIVDLTDARTVGSTTQREGASRLVFQDGVTFDVVADAHAPGGRARARFAGASSFAFVGERGTVMEYRRLAQAREAIASLHRRAAWRPEWFLITGVRTFEAMTLIVAESAGAEVLIEGSGALVGAGDHLKAGATVTVSTGRAATWTLKTATPLYEGLFVRQRLLGSDQIRTGYLDTSTAQSAGTEAMDEIARLTPDETGLLDAAADQLSD